MQLTIIASFFALALGVTAMPQGPGGSSINQVTEQHPGGEKACCLAHSNIHADGILAGALSQGILTPLIGSKEQSCAKFQLIENLNLLGFTEEGSNGKGCRGTPAVCHGNKVCVENDSHEDE